MKCEHCGGPAVRLVQSGKLSCARQCREGAVNMARRITLEEATGNYARFLGSELPKGTGFVLVLFNFGSEGSMAYASSGERTSTKAMLQELLDKLRVETDDGAKEPKQTVAKHATSEDCPCCHTCLAPGLDTDRALVAAFLCGGVAHEEKVPVRAALCAHHARLAGEGADFVNAHARADR